jgi:predicted nucleic acid-binding protein
MTGLLDTNVALYLLGGRVASPFPPGSYGISVITEMELLAWPSLNEQEEKKVQEFLNVVTICELTASIRARAVELRKLHRLKLPDAVVCATAMEFAVELWTTMPVWPKFPVCAPARLVFAPSWIAQKRLRHR